MAAGQPVIEGVPDYFAEFSEWLARRGVGNPSFFVGARSLLRRFPDPQEFATIPLSARLAEGAYVRPILNFLMLHGYLHPGYDYLLDRKLSVALILHWDTCRQSHSWPCRWASKGLKIRGPPQTLLTRSSRLHHWQGERHKQAA